MQRDERNGAEAHTLWFNHHFSSIYNVLLLIDQGVNRFGFPGSLKIILSHASNEFVAAPLADVFLQEPDQLDDVAYLAYCLHICQEYKVTLFWPSRKTQYLAQHGADFESLGVTLLCCGTAAQQAIVNDKIQLYQSLASYAEHLPVWHAVHTVAEFTAAYHHLIEQNCAVCLKPAKGIYGQGFKRIDNGADMQKAFVAGDSTTVTLEEARSKLELHEPFSRLMVMQYLEGPEYSVDCLAGHGTLLRCTVRQKSMHTNSPQLITENAELEQLAKQFTKDLGLHHLYNIQFRQHNGQRKLLEINPRMAGGLPYSCMAGVNYPYWALRLAVEPCEALLPLQNTPLKLHQVYEPVIYAYK